MDSDCREALEEALRDLHKNETLERALGRILRRRGMDYQEYLAIIGDVRDRAKRDRVDLLEAARRQLSAP